MKRIQIERRPDWQTKVEGLGFYYHTIDNAANDPLYWDERVAYQFSAAEIDAIETASEELYRMCLTAVDHVVKNDLFSRLAIPEAFRPLVKASWERQDVDLYGRFDFALDEKGVPKMLEFNADTPTSLFEAAVVQWYWLKDYENANGVILDQFNSIHEKLEETLRDIGEKCIERGQTFYFASIADHLEDRSTVDYLRDIASQAGMKTAHIDIEDIGWNGSVFTDLDENPITTIFKLYPWEWLINEEFGKLLTKEPWDMVEPAWKLILSNKGILPILWELFPDHPNLLPSYFDPRKLGNTYVEKPLLSREGADVVIVKDGKVANTVHALGYGEEGRIYQQYLPLQSFDGNIPVLGSWIVGGRAAGMGIREDVNEVTGNTSRFIPHFFTPEG